MSELDKSLEMLKQLEGILKKLNLPVFEALKAARPIVIEAYGLAGKPYSEDDTGVGRWLLEIFQTNNLPVLQSVVGEAVKQTLSYE